MPRFCHCRGRQAPHQSPGTAARVAALGRFGPPPPRLPLPLPLPLLLLLARLPAAGAVAGEALSAESRRPRYTRVDDSIETVWQRPPGEPRGIVFIAHGCKHQATDVFSEVGPDGWRFEDCKRSNFGRCLGLPQEMQLRQAARSRGYLVMAVSGGRGWQSCWDSRADTARVARAVEHVRGEEALPESLPVLAIGASSGGAFVGRLASPLASGGLPHLKCIVPQIMGLSGARNRGVPTLFVHMPRDMGTAARVAADLRGLQAVEIQAEELQVKPVPVTADLLGQCLPEEVAADVAAAVRKAGLLDAGGYLAEDARARLWAAPVRDALAGRSDDTLVADESCLAEMFNVAWAYHEFTAEHAAQMLDFCEGARGEGRSGAAPRKVAAAGEL